MSLICSINTSTTFLLGNFSLSPPSSSTLSLPCVYFTQNQQPSVFAFKTGNQESYGPNLLRKPIISPPSTVENSADEDDDGGGDDEVGREKTGAGLRRRESDSGDERWVDWEDRILEDTVPLVGFVRMVLHSGKYQSGERLSPEHETSILERLLPYHPAAENKIGCGVDYITIGYHPEFEESRCLFIVRKDGELIDFSFWKCIKGFIRKNYPQYADSFILKHFRRRSRRYE